MKRKILTPMILLLCLWALILAGCAQSNPTFSNTQTVPPTALGNPSVPSSIPQTDSPAATPPATVPTDPSVPDGLVLVHLITGYTYDGSGQNKQTDFVYDEAGMLLEISEDGQAIVTCTYDEQGNCLSYKNTRYGIDQTYDAQGNILTDRTEGLFIINTYNADGKCLQVERHSADGALLSVSRYTYNDKGNLICDILERSGSVYYEILHTYDEAGRHVSETYCRDGEISDERASFVWEYDAQGNLLQEQLYFGHTLGRRMEYTYDAAGNQLSACQYNSDGSAYLYYYTYDEAGNVIHCEDITVDADGTRSRRIFEYQYDAHGNKILQHDIDHIGQERYFRWTYDESGKLLLGYSFTSPHKSYKYVYTYDAQGNKLTETKTGDSPHVIRWEYDDQGRVIFVAQTGTSPYEKTYEYDAYGNLIRISSTNSYTAVRDYTYTAIAVTPEAAARLLAQQEEIFRHLNGEVLSIN